MRHQVTLSDPIDAILIALQKSSGASSDFDLNSGVKLPTNRILRPAAVLIPLVDGKDGLDVLLTKRSSALKHHPGQVAFPGGKVDDDDKTVIDAALREAKEEIGLPPETVDILGQLPAHETVTSFTVTPILGKVRADFDITPEPGEVAEVFSVPLEFVTNPANFSIQHRRWRGQKRYYYAVPFGPYYIWGATARILRGLAERMSL